MPPKLTPCLDLEQLDEERTDATSFTYGEEDDGEDDPVLLAPPPMGGALGASSSTVGVSNLELAYCLVRDFLQKHDHASALSQLEKDHLYDSDASPTPSSVVEERSKKEAAYGAEEAARFSNLELLLEANSAKKQARFKDGINSPARAIAKPAGGKKKSIQVIQEDGKTTVGDYELSANRMKKGNEFVAPRRAICDIRKGDMIPSINDIDFEDEIKLGTGASGTVSKNRHKPSGEWIAVKRIKAGKESATELFHELTTLFKRAQASDQKRGGARDENDTGDPRTPESGVNFIVKFYGSFCRDDDVLLALENCDCSLEDARKAMGGRLSEDMLKPIAYQVLRGLQYLHKVRHILHRDIKGGNLLVNKNGMVKITDFGVASDEQVQTLAKMSTFVGTMIYMSPERLQAGAYQADSDLWSLALTLFYCFTGEHMFKGDSIFSIIGGCENNKHLAKIKGMSAPFKKVLVDCLQENQKERPATATELLSYDWFRGLNDTKARLQCESFLVAACTAVAKQRGEGEDDDDLSEELAGLEEVF